jgi:hypothetical protein
MMNNNHKIHNCPYKSNIQCEPICSSSFNNIECNDITTDNIHTYNIICDDTSITNNLKY